MNIYVHKALSTFFLPLHSLANTFNNSPLWFISFNWSLNLFTVFLKCLFQLLIFLYHYCQCLRSGYHSFPNITAKVFYLPAILLAPSFSILLNTTTSIIFLKYKSHIWSKSFNGPLLSAVWSLSVFANHKRLLPLFNLLWSYPLVTFNNL